jgi:hypothetical protein
MLARVVRAGGATRLAAQRGASYSMWDRVRPSFWHPMTTLEQSMLELDRMTSEMMSAPFHFAKSMVPRMHTDDDDFFKDLVTPSEMKEGKGKPQDGDKREKNIQKVGSAGGGQSYSSYSYSSSTILDENGHRVTSVRRRYEDSTGRLKAVHEREIDGKKVKSVWKRKEKLDEGDYKTLTEATSEEEFEEAWKKTPFGKAESQRHVEGETDTKPQGVLQCEQEAEKITPGPDYGAAEKAPDKEEGQEAEGVTKEAHDRTRDDAIAQGSKTQEEETTPPKYTSGAPGYT